MTTRTLSSSSAAMNASFNSTNNPRFCAFRLSGRSNKMRTILPSSWDSTFRNLYSAMDTPSTR